MFIYKKSKLNNGLQLWQTYLPNTHSISIGLFVKAGVQYEKKKFIGISHLLEHLHFRELNNMNQDDLYYLMESMGTTLRAETYRDFIYFHMKVLPKYFEKTLDIWKGILQTHNWSIDALEKEKEVVIRQIAEYSDFNIDTISRQNYMGNISLSNQIMGSLEGIKKITSEDILEHKKKFFSSTNMVMCISGNFDKDAIEHINEKIGKIRLPNRHLNENCEFQKNFGKRKSDFLIDDNNWNICEVDICFDIDVNLYDLKQIDVLNCILGEGVGSKLQKVLREKYGLSSDISSFVEKYKYFEFLHIRFSVERENLLFSLELVVNVLNGLKKKIIVGDLNVAVPFYTDCYDFLLDDPEELNFMNGWNEFVLGRPFGRYDCIEKSPNIYSQIAKRLFIKSNLSLTILGKDCCQIKKSINQIIEKINT